MTLRWSFKAFDALTPTELYALLRFKMIAAANPGAINPGPILVVMGLVSLIFAAFMLYMRRDIKRLFAYSSIEHMGLITFAFGIYEVLDPAAIVYAAAHDMADTERRRFVNLGVEGRGLSHF